ncbi:Hypothetical predicted protein [Olea europaea subsp. europaea]|uniref:Uncharacterized protein n=1 Tax=Olea europaea subsp. europaea TaxID=158383 RepID=A0A8S0QLP6_OLEEU|nr:Hypothetical predicted protein [Olea europaea subsp. europaea]
MRVVAVFEYFFEFHHVAMAGEVVHDLFLMADVCHIIGVWGADRVDVDKGWPRMRPTPLRSGQRRGRWSIGGENGDAGVSAVGLW